MPARMRTNKNHRYLTISTDFGIPSLHRPEKPDDNVALEKYYYLDPWYKVCLNCNLEKCYRDDERDDTYIKRGTKKLCPIEIGKKMEWTPERVLSEQNE